MTAVLVLDRREALLREVVQLVPGERAADRREQAAARSGDHAQPRRARPLGRPVRSDVAVARGDELAVVAQGQDRIDAAGAHALHE
ncbi:MAG TPA: hypothetical protein VIX73_19295, partial [Kofleriaceae bacterium]